MMRTPEPATLLCTTIRMVWLSKDGPPVVMLGDQALTRVPLLCEDDVAALAACAVLNGTTVRIIPVTAPNTDSRDLRRGRRSAAVPSFSGDIVVLSTLRVIRGGPAPRGVRPGPAPAEDGRIPHGGAAR
ncbi:hypothetical protein GCM10010345_60510 [Streptomyces canarius]|uniref:Uncharacterized protein n=1 Tax=Streptomyces canarius TaxID=285453 RepID=A0ABQ3CXC3_9ACTN|nr:hypothetical protein GCM10010345_60510 [Streptomyces canarius]